MHGNNPATQQGPGIPRPACIPSPPPPPRPGPNPIPDRTGKAQRPETPSGQEKKTKGWASRAWDNLKTFRATILTGTAAGTAMATVYMILAMDARGCRIPSALRRIRRHRSIPEPRNTLAAFRHAQNKGMIRDPLQRQKGTGTNHVSPSSP